MDCVVNGCGTYGFLSLSMSGFQAFVYTCIKAPEVFWALNRCT